MRAVSTGGDEPQSDAPTATALSPAEVEQKPEVRAIRVHNYSLRSALQRAARILDVSATQNQSDRQWSQIGNGKSSRQHCNGVLRELAFISWRT